MNAGSRPSDQANAKDICKTCVVGGHESAWCARRRCQENHQGIHTYARHDVIQLGTQFAAPVGTQYAVTVGRSDAPCEFVKLCTCSGQVSPRRDYRRFCFFTQ